MNPNQKNWIKVGKTGRVISGRPEYFARLYIRSMLVFSTTRLADPQDADPEGSTITLMWHKFEQETGKDIRRTAL